MHKCVVFQKRYLLCRDIAQSCLQKSQKALCLYSREHLKSAEHEHRPGSVQEVLTFVEDIRDPERSERSGDRFPVHIGIPEKHCYLSVFVPFLPDEPHDLICSPFRLVISVAAGKIRDAFRIPAVSSERTPEIPFCKFQPLCPESVRCLHQDLFRESSEQFKRHSPDLMSSTGRYRYSCTIVAFAACTAKAYRHLFCTGSDLLYHFCFYCSKA